VRAGGSFLTGAFRFSGRDRCGCLWDAFRLVPVRLAEFRFVSWVAAILIATAMGVSVVLWRFWGLRVGFCFVRRMLVSGDR